MQLKITLDRVGVNRMVSGLADILIMVNPIPGITYQDIKGIYLKKKDLVFQAAYSQPIGQILGSQSHPLQDQLLRRFPVPLVVWTLLQKTLY